MIDRSSPVGEKNKKVRLRWKEKYLDHLGSLSLDPEIQKQQIPAWIERNGQLSADLLHDMGSAVGHDFDPVHIRRAMYSPQGYANWESENRLLRTFLLEGLAGERTLPMDIRTSKEAAEAQKKLNEALLDYFDGKRPNSSADR